MGRGRSKMGQDGSRSRQKAPSWIKISPKRAKMSQRKTEMGQDRVKMGPRWGQDGANMGQAGAKMGQDGAKIGPTWANIGPRWAKMRHRGYPPVSPRSHCKKQQKPTCFRGRRLGYAILFCIGEVCEVEAEQPEGEHGLWGSTPLAGFKG